MSSNERELKFRITSDSSQTKSDVKGTTESVRVSVAELRAQLGKDFSRIVAEAANGVKEAQAIINRAVSGSVLSLKEQMAGVAALDKQRVAAQLGAFKEGERAVESLQAKRSAALLALHSQMEKTLLFDRGQIGKGTSYTDQIIAESKRAIIGFQQTAGATESALIRTEGALFNANREAASFSNRLKDVGTVAVPAALALAGLGFGLYELTQHFFKLVEASAKYGEEIFKASQKSSLAAETVSVLKVAAEEAHVPFDSLSRGFARFENNLVRASQDSKSQVAVAFRAIGFEGERLAEAIRHPDKAVREFIDIFNRLPPTAERDALAIRLLGRDAYNLIPAINQMKGGFAEAEERARSMGLVFSDDAAVRAHALEVATRDLGLAWEGLKVSFAAPVMEEVTFQVIRLTRAIRESRQEADGAAPGMLQWLEIGLDSARRLADLLGGVLVGALGAVQTVFSPLTAAVIVVGNSLSYVAQVLAYIFNPSQVEKIRATREEFNSMALAAIDMISTFKRAGGLFGGVFSGSPFKGNLQDELEFDREMERRRRELKNKTQIDNIEFESREEQRAQARREADERRALAIELQERQRQSRARIQILQQSAQQAQRIFQQQLEDEKRSYEEREISLREFVAAQKASAKELLDAQVKAFSEEVVEIQGSDLTGSEKATKLAEVFTKSVQARAAYHKTVEQANLEAEKKERESAEAHAHALLDIYDTRDKALMASIKAAGEGRIATAEATESALAAVERAGFDRREDALKAELVQAGRNLEERRKVEDQLSRFAAERAAFEEDALRRVQRAREADLESVRRYHDEINRLQQAGREAELQNARDLFDEYKSGVFTREQLERVRLEFERGALQEEHQINEEHLERRRYANVETERFNLGYLDSQRKFAAESLERAVKERGRVDDALKDAREAVASEAAKGAEADADYLNQLRARVKDAEAALRDAVAQAKAAQEEYRALSQKVGEQQDVLRKAEEKANAEEEAERDRHTKATGDLDKKREAMLVADGNRLALTRKEIIEAEFDLRKREEEARHKRQAAELTSERDFLAARQKILRQEAETLRGRGLLDEANAKYSEAESLAERIRSLNRQIEAEDVRHSNANARGDRERGRLLEREDPNSQRSLFGDTFKDSFDAYNKYLRDAGRNTNNFRATLFGLANAAGDVFHQMSEDAGNFLSIALEGFRELTAGIGDLVTNWVLLGEVGPNALRKLLASIIAHYAASWIIKAIDLTAEGFSNLAKASAAAAAGDFRAAALYKTAAVQDFISAAKYGAGGAIAAVIGRQVAGNSFASGGSGEGAGSGGGDDNQPNNRQFNYGGNNLATPASGDLSDGSRGGIGPMIAGLIERVEQAQKQNAVINAKLDSTLSRIQSLPAGDVVALGASDARGAVAAAVLEHSSENYEVARTLLEHQGFAR
jgi:hypothetical protein